MNRIYSGNLETLGQGQHKPKNCYKVAVLMIKDKNNVIYFTFTKTPISTVPNSTFLIHPIISPIVLEQLKWSLP